MSTTQFATKAGTWIHPRAAEIVSAAFAIPPTAPAIQDNRDRLNRPRRTNRDQRQAA